MVTFFRQRTGPTSKLTWRLVPSIQGPRPPVEVMSEAVLLILAPTEHGGRVGYPQRELNSGIVMGSLYSP